MVAIGGGLAGASLATQLARQGRDVLLIERRAEPHDKVCGEFLSAGALTALRRLGLDAAALGAAPVERVRLCSGRRAAAAPLPFPAAGLSRRVLDEAMLARAAASGVEVRRGVAARIAAPGIVEADGTWQARHVVLATGKHDLRGHARPVAGDAARWVGLKLHLRLRAEARAALDRSVVMGLFGSGYAGLQPVEQGWANLCLATRDPALVATSRDAEGLVSVLGAASPHLAEMLHGAEPRWPKPVAVAGVPYGYLHDGTADGAFRLGDQFGVIPSFCGDGMAIALASARAAAETILAGLTPAAYHAEMSARLRPQFRRAAWLSRLMATASGRCGLLAAAHLVPSLLTAAAAATRVPDRIEPARAPAVAAGPEAWSG